MFLGASHRLKHAHGVSYKVSAYVAVSDMARAKEFYEGKLGLPGVEDRQDSSREYACGGDTSLHVYPSPANAGKAPATVATWRVDNVARIVDELASNGVTFEHYDEPEIRTDEKGIVALDDGRVAWF